MAPLGQGHADSWPGTQLDPDPEPPVALERPPVPVLRPPVPVLPPPVFDPMLLRGVPSEALHASTTPPESTATSNPLIAFIMKGSRCSSRAVKGRGTSTPRSGMAG